MPEKEDIAAARRDERVMRALKILDRVDSPYWGGDVDVSGVKIKLGGADGMESLVIVTGRNGDGLPVVAFHSALGGLDALAGALNRLANGGLKWKEDEYAKP